MARNYTVETINYDSEGEMFYGERPIERPINEEDEALLQIGHYVLAAIDEPNFSVLCKVMNLTDDNVLLRRLSE
jgi:hypothetical protein